MSSAPDWSGVKKTRGREASQGDSVPWQSCWDDCRGGTQLRHIYRKRFPESDAQRNDTLHHLIVWLLEGECNTQRDPVNSGTTDVTTAKDQSRLAFFHLHLRKEADATKWSGRWRLHQRCAQRPHGVLVIQHALWITSAGGENVPPMTCWLWTHALLQTSPVVEQALHSK